jgi:hypothetical protein
LVIEVPASRTITEKHIQHKELQQNHPEASADTGLIIRIGAKSLHDGDVELDRSKDGIQWRFTSVCNGPLMS